MPEPRSGRPRQPSRRAVLAAAGAGLGTALTASLTSCSSASGGTSKGITLTMTWWGNDDRAERTKQAVRLFEKENPGVTVQTSNADFNSYMQKLATQAAGGGIPDVAQLDYRQISQYAGGGALLPLSDVIRDRSMRTRDIDPEFLRTGTYEGKQYAIPAGRGITGFAYDTRIYKKAGIPTPRPDWTWADWAAANRKIAALGLKSPDGRATTGSNDGGVNEDVFENWLRGHGKSLYAGQQKLGFTEDDLTEFWTFCNDLRKDGAIAAARDTSQATSTETSPMGRGLAAADYNWDATFPGVADLVGDHVHFAPVPSVDGRQGTYFKPSMLFGVGSQSQHPKEACALVDFLINDRRAGDALGFTRSTPPNQPIARRVSKTLKGAEREIYEYGESMDKYGLDAPPTAPPRGDVAVQTAFTRQYERVAYELASPRQAARELIEEANRELTS
ncbi:putative ABC transporter substrate-binding protein YesO [Streptomyces sp. YIM 130001]|uniref:ABC transporter substrate-binding protein n=1 Tax=Streptomyces sp. YIM 130001 TaxID=2259644 RepID=UPI000E655CFF|nr:sugar ABC transporter substrate-binding protein [Streptomyces sp. YIM 130001]RII20551.1 putative ABC transporter substrate-binding protein YesO [Streptomyces sp. YIM 130001]